MKIIFYTQGCRTNQAETVTLKREYVAKGYTLVSTIEDAEIAVINTCTVTKKADRDLRLLVNKLKRQNPQVEIFITGCQKVLPEGTRTLSTRKCQVKNPTWHFSNLKVLVPLRANLKIQDGCDAFCAYCIVPYVRGRAKSLDFEEILGEAKYFVKAGHKEIVLTGINIGAYDFQEKLLEDLLEELIKIPKLERIRISSIEPNKIRPALIDLMANEPKICRFLHIPLQSGSNIILDGMGRKYKVENYRELILDIVEKVPEICIGTDVIVGFPGESEEDFQKTYEFLASLPLAYFHVFPYSERDGTKAASMPNQVTSQIKKTRSKLLRELGDKKRKIFHESLIGTEQTVLIEEKKNGLWTGLTDNYIRVCLESEKDLKNQLQKLLITNTNTQFLKNLPDN